MTFEVILILNDSTWFRDKQERDERNIYKEWKQQKYFIFSLTYMGLKKSAFFEIILYTKIKFVVRLFSLLMGKKIIWNLRQH